MPAADIGEALLQLHALRTGLSEAAGEGPGRPDSDASRLLENRQNHISVQQDRHHIHPVARPVQIRQRWEAG